MQKLVTNTWKIIIKIKNCHIFNLYGLEMLLELPVSNFECLKILPNLIKISLKTLMKKVMKDVFFNLMFNIFKNYMTFSMIYHFYEKEQKLKKSKSL